MTVKTPFVVVVVGVLFSGLAASAAMAASAQVESNLTKAAEAVRVQPAAATEDEESAACSKPRKRLWVDGEGWIVRRVTICR